MWVLIQYWRLTIWVVGVPLLLGVVGHFLIYKLFRKVTKNSKNLIDDSLVKHCYKPLQWTIVLLIIRIALMASSLPDEQISELNHILSLLLIAGISWLLIKTVYVLEDFIVRQFEVDVKRATEATPPSEQELVILREKCDPQRLILD